MLNVQCTYPPAGCSFLWTSHTRIWIPTWLRLTLTFTLEYNLQTEPGSRQLFFTPLLYVPHLIPSLSFFSFFLPPFLIVWNSYPHVAARRVFPLCSLCGFLLRSTILWWLLACFPSSTFPWPGLGLLWRGSLILLLYFFLPNKLQVPTVGRHVLFSKVTFHLCSYRS